MSKMVDLDTFFRDFKQSRDELLDRGVDRKQLRLLVHPDVRLQIEDAATQWDTVPEYPPQPVIAIMGVPILLREDIGQEAVFLVDGRSLFNHRRIDIKYTVKALPTPDNSPALGGKPSPLTGNEPGLSRTQRKDRE